MDDIVAAVGATLRHPSVLGVELVGSRAMVHRPLSDWDFVVVTERFDEVARAPPALVAELEPLGQQWDRISAYPCYMLMLAGPVKVDLLPGRAVRPAAAVDRERRDPRRDRPALLGLDPVARVQAGASERTSSCGASWSRCATTLGPLGVDRGPELDPGRGRGVPERPGTGGSASSASGFPAPRARGAPGPPTD